MSARIEKAFRVCLASLALLLLLVPSGSGASDPRVTLSVQLRKGQTLVYQVHYHAERDTKTESRVVAPLAPRPEPFDLVRTVRVTVLESVPEGSHTRHTLRTQVLGADTSSPNSAPKTVDFTVDAAGTVSEINGLESLALDERQLWRDWVERFAAVWAFPPKLKPGEKWTSEEPVEDSVLAGLVWQKESQYVRDEPCPAASAIGDATEPRSSREACAVILTRATLKQRSSPKDATPEDYKLHDLKTSGTARGNNEIISYASRKSGLIVRATEQAIQFMDVVIGKTDGSNRVHYNIDAKSHSEILLTANGPAAAS